MVGGKITDQDTAGIQVITRANGLPSSDTGLTVQGVLIAGGQCGIDFGGLDNQLFLHDTTVRGPDPGRRSGSLPSTRSSIWAIRVRRETTCCRSNRGGFAPRRRPAVARSSSIATIRAAGTTLNGASFDGQDDRRPRRARTVLPDHRLRLRVSSSEPRGALHKDRGDAVHHQFRVARIFPGRRDISALRIGVRWSR